MSVMRIDIPDYLQERYPSIKDGVNHVEIDVPTYSPERGVWPLFEPYYHIMVQIDDGEAVIRADKAGLITLARHMLTLAQDEVPSGAHIHYDADNFLEDGSRSMIIDKLPGEGEVS